MYGLAEDVLDTDQFDDLHIVALTAWGEARGEDNDGMQAVLNSVQNRLTSGVRWWGYSYRTICLMRWQYSCWNAKDPNRSKIMAVTEENLQFKIALQLASQLLAGNLPDIICGADSYVDSRLADKPSWCRSREPVFILHHHWFYKTI